MESQSGYREIVPGTKISHEYWDQGASEYARENLEHLTIDRLIWGPEGWDEAEVRWLGDPSTLAARQVIEIGCGLGQGTRYLSSLGAKAVGIDVAAGMIREGVELAARNKAPAPPLIAADATQLPFAADTFDLAFSAFGAVAFVLDLAALYSEVARVLKPGSRWVFTTAHPMRWVFSDDPADVAAPAMRRSYFDRRPYVEMRGEVATYAEFHHTLEDHAAALAAAGFVIEDLKEPRFAPGIETTWAGWSKERAEMFPGTLLISARLR